MDGFDSDVLIYAATAGDPLGRRVRALFAYPPADGFVGVGSVLLLPEVLTRPIRDENLEELARRSALLSRLELRPTDQATAEMATGLAAKYRLHAADAVHLATAVLAGADRFLTNNRRDFSGAIEEISVVCPEDLPDPGD
jgi:predicted nucleic acid-binding protein